MNFAISQIFQMRKKLFSLEFNFANYEKKKIKKKIRKNLISKIQRSLEKFANISPRENFPKQSNVTLKVIKSVSKNSIISIFYLKQVLLFYLESFIT